MARTAARHGARGVLVVDRDGAAAAGVAEELGAVERALVADLAEPAAAEEIVKHAEAEFGGIDVYFSNAGIAIPGGVDLN